MSGCVCHHLFYEQSGSVYGITGTGKFVISNVFTGSLALEGSAFKPVGIELSSCGEVCRNL